MIEQIQNINPKELKDLSQLQDLIVLFMNVVESQSKELKELRAENQELRNEVNRLKGEHGDLAPKTPKTNPTNTRSNKEKKKAKKKNNKRGPKNPKIKIDRIVKCEIDKSVLPADAKFQGYKEVIQQDIIIQRNNTLFKIPTYYSKKENRTYRGQLPEDYQGQFGGQLKSWVQLLHHYCDVTHGRLKALFDNIGILISTGTISNILLSNVEVMKSESRAILRSGIEQDKFAQSDGTKGWEAGQGKSTQIICGPSYTVYHTMASKSKGNIIWALQGKPGKSIPLRYDTLAVELLAGSKVPKKDQKLLSQLLKADQHYSLESFESLLAEQAAHLLEKQSHAKVVEILALAHYFGQAEFPILQNLLTDAGPEYIGIALGHGLCWLHEERHYKKMVPVLKVNQLALNEVRGKIWDFYGKLLDFKELSPAQQHQQKQKQKQKLEKEFEQIFTTMTDYNDLNNRLQKTFAKKEKLLRVLDFPDLPLHNNAAELAVRRKVRKRDISLHTMSSKGTEAQDAFMSVIETAAKLGVNALDYLYDRIIGRNQMPHLADLIKLNTL